MLFQRFATLVAPFLVLILKTKNSTPHNPDFAIGTLPGFIKSQVMSLSIRLSTIAPSGVHGFYTRTRIRAYPVSTASMFDRSTTRSTFSHAAKARVDHDRLIQQMVQTIAQILRYDTPLMFLLETDKFTFSCTGVALRLLFQQRLPPLFRDLRGYCLTDDAG